MFFDASQSCQGYEARIQYCRARPPQRALGSYFNQKDLNVSLLQLD